MNTKTKFRTYTELRELKTFKERYEYLKLDGVVGQETFGFDRYLNQVFYRSDEWRKVRDHVIFRDNGCDLGIVGHEINGRITIHHMNSMSIDDILKRSDWILDPEFLISTLSSTHRAIHYGTEELILAEPVIRLPNDTCPWKH